MLPTPLGVSSRTGTFRIGDPDRRPVTFTCPAISACATSTLEAALARALMGRKCISPSGFSCPQSVHSRIGSHVRATGLEECDVSRSVSHQCAPFIAVLHTAEPGSVIPVDGLDVEVLTLPHEVTTICSLRRGPTRIDRK